MGWLGSWVGSWVGGWYGSALADESVGESTVGVSSTLEGAATQVARPTIRLMELKVEFESLNEKLDRLLKQAEIITGLALDPGEK